MEYNPHKPLEKEKWLSITESERIDQVIDYHKHQKIKLPNAMMHAIIHVTVENQAALGDDYPVEAKLKQLMQEGLDRHDAIHAVGSVLAENLYGMFSGDSRSGEADQDTNKAYLEKLKNLTAVQWREK